MVRNLRSIRGCVLCAGAVGPVKRGANHTRSRAAAHLRPAKSVSCADDRASPRFSACLRERRAPRAAVERLESAARGGRARARRRGERAGDRGRHAARREPGARRSELLAQRRARVTPRRQRRDRRRDQPPDVAHAREGVPRARRGPRQLLGHALPRWAARAGPRAVPRPRPRGGHRPGPRDPRQGLPLRRSGLARPGEIPGHGGGGDLSSARFHQQRRP